MGSEESSPRVIENLFLLLRTVKSPELNEQKQIDWNYFVEVRAVEIEGPPAQGQSKVGAKRKRQNEASNIKSKNPHTLSLEKFKNAFQACWTAYLSIQGIPDNIFCTILRNIHVDLMPNFVEPILLMDLLTDTYDKAEKLIKEAEGKVIDAKVRAQEEEKSLLALNGLFTLIVNHNLYVLFACLVFPFLVRLSNTPISCGTEPKLTWNLKVSEFFFCGTFFFIVGFGFT